MQPSTTSIGSQPQHRPDYAELPTTWEQIDALTADNDGRGSAAFQRSKEIGAEVNGTPPPERSPELAEHIGEPERNLLQKLPSNVPHQLHPAERIALRNAKLDRARPPLKVPATPRTVRRAECSGRPSGRSTRRRSGATSSSSSSDPGSDSDAEPASSPAARLGGKVRR
jgi:hypothetical protein